MPISFALFVIAAFMFTSSKLRDDDIIADLEYMRDSDGDSAKEIELKGRFFDWCEKQCGCSLHAIEADPTGELSAANRSKRRWHSFTLGFFGRVAMFFGDSTLDGIANCVRVVSIRRKPAGDDLP